MQGKLNPQGTARINFPGFQKILDFTAAGGEAPISVTVDGDADKEYMVEIRNTDTSNYLRMRLNNDSATHYGRQIISNGSGTITAFRGTLGGLYITAEKGRTSCHLITASGFSKLFFQSVTRWSSGTGIDLLSSQGVVWDSAVNVTSINFAPDSGNFIAGTRITVFSRRSQL